MGEEVSDSLLSRQVQHFVTPAERRVHVAQHGVDAGGGVVDDPDVLFLRPDQLGDQAPRLLQPRVVAA